MRLPTATYRLQVNADFTLQDAASSADYLHDLGITDLYLSPVFEALPGSTHGYDVTDPTRIRAELGGRAAFDALSGRARELGLGVLLDIVPNHMAASEHNPWWRDILRHGPASRFAPFYDIDWGRDPERAQLLLPILGAPLAEVLAEDALRLAQAEDGECSLLLYGRQLPLALERCPADTVAAYHAADHEQKRDILREVLERQHYRLEHWVVAGERLGYRRFFDITDLAGVRVELPEVFAATHSLILELVRGGQLDGLRIDHVDGLRDPAAYLEQLRREAGIYTVVEKILERNEPLPPWPVEGTTGYEFLNQLNGLFVDPDGHARIARAYLRITGQSRTFPEIVREKKLLVLERLFGGELAALAALLQPLLGCECDVATATRVLTHITVALPVYRTYITAGHCSARDRELLERVLAESAPALSDLPPELLERLRRVLLLDEPADPAAALEFILRWQQLTGPVMAKGFEDTALYVHTAFIAANEVGGNPAEPCLSVNGYHRRMAARAAGQPHALSATATHDTKRGEDTRARLDVLSERGDEWARLLRNWASRSEEHKEEAVASAGLDEDAPVPNAREESLLYQTLLGAWPMTGEAGPAFIERIKQYMVKALREAKESTSWRKPDADYETVLAAFVEQLLAEPWWPGLREEIRAYAGEIAWHGALNSLSQVLLKVTSPGVPDFYQGTELWSLSLVDPDNRRPVDYQERRDLLRQLEPLLAQPSPAGVHALLEDWQSGAIKLYLTAAALRLRRRRAELYALGSYTPLDVEGEAAEHVIAFARTAPGGQAALTVATRLLGRLCGHGQVPAAATWGDTSLLLPPELQAREWRNVLTGERHAAGSRLRIAALLESLPLALLD